MELYGPKMWSKAIQFCEIFPPWTEKGFLFNLKSYHELAHRSSSHVCWSLKCEMGWSWQEWMNPCPFPCQSLSFPQRGWLWNRGSQHLLWAKLLILPSRRPATSRQLTGEVPRSEITAANSTPRVRRQIENATTANNFYKLQSWQICQKHFGIELSLEINDPNGTQLVPY